MYSFLIILIIIIRVYTFLFPYKKTPLKPWAFEALRAFPKTFWLF